MDKTDIILMKLYKINILEKVTLIVIILIFIGMGVQLGLGISLSSVEIEIENQCVNETTKILIYPKTLDNRTAIIDSANISSMLNNTPGSLIFEDGHFIKEVIFTENGEDIIVLEISEQEKTIKIEKEINIQNCYQNRVSEKLSKLGSIISKNKETLFLISIIIIFLIVLSITIKISKN